MDTVGIEQNIDQMCKLLKALSNEKRLLIACELCHDEKSVSELESYIKLSQSALSQHLARLRRDGLVKTRRQAQTIYYSISDQHVKDMIKSLNALYKETP
jgi:DNA-binding transcriptional ArsR family regulator